METASPDRTGRKAKPVSLLARLTNLAKEALFFIYLYSGYVQLRDLTLSLLGRSRAVVLYYHRVGGFDVLTKPEEDFRRDLEYLKKSYECIGLFELCERLSKRTPLRRRSVVITFDDGYRDNFTLAVPALESAGLTATFFVATGFIGTDRAFPHDLSEDESAAAPHHPKLTWDDLRSMQAAGFELGSHTVNHTNLGRADEQTIEHEVFDSLVMLNRELGTRPRPFSFPWGKPEDMSDKAAESIRLAGYYAAASAYGGANSRGADLFNIRRVDVGNGRLSRLALRARVAGLDPDYFRLKLNNLKLKNLKTEI